MKSQEELIEDFFNQPPYTFKSMITMLKELELKAPRKSLRSTKKQWLLQLHSSLQEVPGGIQTFLALSSGLRLNEVINFRFRP